MTREDRLDLGEPYRNGEDLMRRLFALVLIALLVLTPALAIVEPAPRVVAQEEPADPESPTATPSETAVPPTETPVPSETATATAELPTETATATNTFEPDPPTNTATATFEDPVEPLSSSTPTGTATPDDQLQPGDIVRVIVNLNMRESAATTSNVIAVLPGGTEATVLEGPILAGGYEWVRLDTGSAYGIGWSVTLYLDKVQSGPSPTPTATTDPASVLQPGDIVRAVVNLNMRTSASTSAQVSAVLLKGVEATVIEGPVAAGGYEWVRLDGGATFGLGWSVTIYLEKVGSGPSPTPTSTPDSIIRPGDGVRTVVNLNMRSGSSTTSSVVAVLPTGTQGLVLEGPVTGGGLDWIRIDAGTYGLGWVALQYLQKTGVIGTATPTATATATYPPGQFPINEKVVVDTDGLNLRSGPGTSNSVVAVLLNGAQGTILEGPVNASGFTWYRASFSVGTGWIASIYLASLSAVTPTPAVSLSQIAVRLDCTSNPERIEITNNGNSSITIISIDTLVDRTAAEPFSLNQTLGAKQTRVYQAGSGASGQYRLTSNLILTNTAGDQEGVRIATSSGTLTKRCAPVASGEKWIEVDLSDQFMIVWQGSTQISSTYVSTGKRYFETPTGTFYTNVKYLSQTMAGCILGECYNVPNVPHVMYFTNYGHAIHGAYWHNDFGTPRSHGCVNLPLAFAEWLYYWAPIGTRVYIHY